MLHSQIPLAEVQDQKEKEATEKHVNCSDVEIDCSYVITHIIINNDKRRHQWFSSAEVHYLCHCHRFRLVHSIIIALIVTITPNVLYTPVCSMML